MNRSQLRSVGGPGLSIKDRVGFPKGRPTKGKLQVKLASRLGLPIKSRIGPIGKGKGLVAVGDARQKILLNRVSKGRVGGRLGDARAKIEAKRIQKKISSPSKMGSIKSLRITANLAPGGRPGGNAALVGRTTAMSTSRGPPNFSAAPAGGYNRREPTSAGYFANLGKEPFNKAGGIRISVPGGSSSISSSTPSMSTVDPGESLFLTRTVSNPQATSSSTSSSRSWNSSVAKVAPSFSRTGGGYGADEMEMDDDSPPRIRISNSLQSRLDTHEESPRYRLLVSNLQPSVTTEDIVELFSDINTPISAQITTSGHAEVVYSKKSDCLKAVEAYHNRLLDGSPMRVVLENNSTTLKSAGGATMKLPKASSSVKIQPDISAIHKVLFNPSSGNSTRGLFKGGQ